MRTKGTLLQFLEVGETRRWHGEGTRERKRQSWHKCLLEHDAVHTNCFMAHHYGQDLPIMEVYSCLCGRFGSKGIPEERVQ